MPSFMRAETVDPVTGKHGPGAGAINETATTKTEAIAKARSLKQRGYAVLVTDTFAQSQGSHAWGLLSASARCCNPSPATGFISEGRAGLAMGLGMRAPLLVGRRCGLFDGQFEANGSRFLQQADGLCRKAGEAFCRRLGWAGIQTDSPPRLAT